MEREEEKKKGANGATSLGIFIAFLWVLLGVLGFLTSIVCFAYDGTFMQNWIGLLTAATMGPFYWIYFAFVGERYCSSGLKQQQQQGGRLIASKKGGKRVPPRRRR